MRTIRVGTRQSALALTQTGHVITALEQICKEQQLPYQFEIVKIVTKGDQILDVTLSKVGGKGLFVKEIEQALMDGVIDIAVHSMKDVPSELPEGLMIGAVPRREDPRDCIISRGGMALDELPQGARVGTSSLRRACQLKNYRPDLQIESIRGNIDSRIRKLETEGFDAVVLAAAGLNRMDWANRISSHVSTEVSVPAVAQGALGIECREADAELRTLLTHYNDAETALTVKAERAFLKRLNGGCQIPIGAYASLSEQSELTVTGIIGSPDGAELLKETMVGMDAEQIGTALAEKLLELGGERILADINKGMNS